MENKLNQQIENEIKAIISDISYYKCNDRTITNLSRLSLTLNTDFSEELSEGVSFNGHANFDFESQIEGCVIDTYPCHFTGNATIQNYHVIEVNKPIFIQKGLL